MKSLSTVWIALLAGGCAPAGDAPRNLLLVTADALRADRLGSTSARHLDAFVDEALVFERCISSAPTTAGAIGTLLTGRPAHEVGSPGPLRGLTPAHATLAESLADEGWLTAAFVSTRALGSDLGWSRGFAQYTQPEEGSATLDDYDVTRAARRWLLHVRDPARPFLLWVHLAGGHGPYAIERDEAFDALRPFRKELQEAGAERSAGRTLPLLPDNRGRGGVPLYQQVGARRGGRSEAAHVLNYDLRVMRTCFLVGELRHVLKREELYRNTVLVLLGTHGEALGEHGAFFLHGEQLFEEDLAVPLVLRVPANDSDRGVPTEGIVSTLDLLPTLLALFDVRHPLALPGDDLLDPDNERRGWSFSESYPPGATRRTFALTTARWKVLQSAEGGDLQCFDTQDDPREEHSLQAPFPQAARATLASFHALVDPILRAPEDAAPAGSLSAAQARLWRGLGYDL